MLKKTNTALALALWLWASGLAAEVRVAVAANFTKTAEKLIHRYSEDRPQARIVLSSAATGTLFAQISHGAPFDILLSADEERPALLEQAGRIVEGSRFTYALGRLALLAPGQALGPDALENDRVIKIAIANPELAPYGLASMDTLRAWQLLPGISAKLVYAQNVAQSYALIASGNAQAGFVGTANLQPTDKPFLVPAKLHRPIRQDAVLLARAAENETARDFLRFLRSEAGQRVIAADGYLLPEATDALLPRNPSAQGKGADAARPDRRAPYPAPPPAA